MKNTIIIFISIISLRVFSQGEYPVSYKIPDIVETKAGASFTLAASFNVKAPWYIYAPTGNNAAQGMIETNVIYQLPKGISRKGKIELPKSHFKGGFEVYEGKDIVMSQEFEVGKDVLPGTYKILAKVSYQTCNEKICLPPIMDELDVVVIVKGDAASNLPVELKFTSMDGREVDLGKLKGKLVLVDCWATWCRPCIAEFDNLKHLYAKYHSKGLEIIGLSADVEAARPKAKEVIALHQLPWPQSFEGKGFEGNSFIKANGITALPAVFLIDKEGNIVDRDARGGRLEGLIERYLK